MYWFDTPSIDVGRGQKLTPFWHCFGANACQIEHGTVIDMLLASKANLFPVNTHRFPLLNIGDGQTSWWQIKEFELVRSLVPCLNINLRTTAKEAVAITRAAFQETGIDLLKLEVLQSNMKIANDRQVVKAAETLAAEGFRIMPLVTADKMTVWELKEIGCPLVRVQAAPIGSGAGVVAPQAVEDCVRIGVPVILDCGIGHADHVKTGMQLGCKGFLVDYLLFKYGRPVEAIWELRAELEKFTPSPRTHFAGSHGDITSDAWYEWAERAPAA